MAERPREAWAQLKLLKIERLTASSFSFLFFSFLFFSFLFFSFLFFSFLFFSFLFFSFLLFSFLQGTKQLTSKPWMQSSGQQNCT